MYMKKTQIEKLTDQLFSMENDSSLLINELEPYVELFMHYECAMLEIETKLNVFDKEFSLHGESNPIESVNTRLKTPMSLMNKLKRLDLPFDISYHLIVKVPIFLSDKVEHVAVEVQFRTIAMDFWASLEHKLRYKKNLSEEKEKEIARRLQLCAEISAKLDNQMQKVKEIIEDDSQFL